MTTDSPEIARLRMKLDHSIYPMTAVAKDDLRYALRLIDDSCKPCAFVDEIRNQGQRLDRM